MSVITSITATDVLSNADLLEEVTVITHAAGTFNDAGEFVPGIARRKTVRVATAPLSGRDRETLPEGLRSMDARKFWSKEPVLVVEQGKTPGDVLEYNGKKWKAVVSDNWSGFHEVMAVEDTRP